ncbi:MAG TPA: 50S ribosomal protein L30 [Nitrospirales bacterium]|nr:50S ribosomal protein L30 [Nitrospirales bacterium]
MGTAKTSQGKLAITLVRSPIGTPRTHRILLLGLGLRRIRHTVIRPATPQVKGLVRKLSYLLTVRKAEGGGE